jgi:hypothetical protein
VHKTQSVKARDACAVYSELATQKFVTPLRFGEDGHGRINFGFLKKKRINFRDIGSSAKQETPLNMYKFVPASCCSYFMNEKYVVYEATVDASYFRRPTQVQWYCLHGDLFYGSP